MIASPVARAVAVKVALVCPCATMTDGGTCRTAGLLDSRAISLLAICAALIRTVKVLIAPTVIENVAGSIAVSASGGGTTFTSAEALEPLRLAVTPAWPYAID